MAAIVRRLSTAASGCRVLLRTSSAKSFSSASPSCVAAGAAVDLSKMSTGLPNLFRFGNRISDCSFALSFNLRRAFSSTVNNLPPIRDPDVEAATKDLLAMNWDEIPEAVINQTKKALSKSSDDKSGHEVLANVFRAAEASVEFGGMLVSLRMTLDDLCGLTGENVVHLPQYVEDAIGAAYKRYITYLDSFGPEETYLRKKVETELGTKMIHLKMRCSGIGSEWGKVTLLGTSGISGSYVELRS